MKESIKNFFKTDKRVMTVMYIAFAVLSIFAGVHLTIPLVLDEVGTIANTAFLYGDNWSICAQSMGGTYYKYGTALFYYPLYCIFRNNPFMLYRTLIAFHMALMSFVPVISYRICRVHLHIESVPKAVLLAISSGGISSLWLYSTYARADATLIVLPWILSLLLLEGCSAALLKNKKKLFINSILLAFSTVFAFASHTRGIVLVIAVCMTILIVSLFYRKHLVNYFVFIPTAGICLVIDKFLSAYCKYGIYGSEGTRHASLESFDFETLAKIITPEGLIIEAKFWVGWIFNLLASSFGLVAIGTIAALILIFAAIRKKTSTTQEFALATFALLCLIGTFLLGALFFFPSAWGFFHKVPRWYLRADRIIYGRYTVGAVGPICLVALYALTNTSKKIIGLKSKLFALVSYIVIIILFALNLGPQLENVPSTNTRYFISLIAFLDIKKARTNSAFPDLTSALTTAALVSLVIMIVILVLTHLRNKRAHLIMMAIVFVVSFVNFTYIFFTVRNNRDNVVAPRVQYIRDYLHDIDNFDKIAEQYPGVFKDDSAHLVKFYQFALPDLNVGKLDYLNKLTDQDNFIIICKKDKIDETIAYCDSTNYYENVDDYYLFETFNYNRKKKSDVIFVKGDDLANLLIENGCNMIKYENTMEE